MITLANKEKDMKNAADRTLRETRRDFDKRIDEIRAELQAKGPGAVEKAERSLNDLKEDLRNGFDDVNSTLDDELESGREQVREHPLFAVGVDVAVLMQVLPGTKTSTKAMSNNTRRAGVSFSRIAQKNWLATLKKCSPWGTPATRVASTSLEYKR